MKDAQQVDVQHPLEGLGVDLQHRPVAGDAGVGHRDIETAEACHRVVDDGLHGGQIAHIGDRGQHLLVAAEFDGDRVERGLVEVGQDEFGPKARNRRATSAPIPRAPPVIRTTLSCSDVTAVYYLSQRLQFHAE